jgi:hypothetical protein
VDKIRRGPAYKIKAHEFNSSYSKSISGEKEIIPCLYNSAPSSPIHFNHEDGSRIFLRKFGIHLQKKTTYQNPEQYMNKHRSDMLKS